MFTVRYVAEDILLPIPVTRLLYPTIAKYRLEKNYKIPLA